MLLLSVVFSKILFLKSILVWMNVRLRILLVGWQRKVENQ